MPGLEGLELLVAKVTAEHETTKKNFAFCLAWIDFKYKDGGTITIKEYREFLSELSKIGGEKK